MWVRVHHGGPKWMVGGTVIEMWLGLADSLEVWPESHWQGFALRQPDVSRSYLA